MENNYLYAHLGAFGCIWATWKESEERIKQQSPTYFMKVINTQLDEIIECYDMCDREHMKLEIIDIISVCLNWFRWLGCDDEEIAVAAIQRALYRFAGQTEQIMTKYDPICGDDDGTISRS